MTEAKGKSRIISFDGRFVTIAPNRSLMGAVNGGPTLRIPISKVEQIEFSPRSMTKNGYIRINTGQPVLTGTLMRPAFMDAIQDPNSVLWSSSSADRAFAQLYDELLEALP